MDTADWNYAATVEALIQAGAKPSQKTEDPQPSENPGAIRGEGLNSAAGSF